MKDQQARTPRGGAGSSRSNPLGAWGPRSPGSPKGVGVPMLQGLLFRDSAATCSRGPTYLQGLQRAEAGNGEAVDDLFLLRAGLAAAAARRAGARGAGPSSPCRARAQARPPTTRSGRGRRGPPPGAGHGPAARASAGSDGPWPPWRAVTLRPRRRAPAPLPLRYSAPPGLLRSARTRALSGGGRRVGPDMPRG